MDELTRLVFVFFATIVATIGALMVVGLVVIYRQVNHELAKLSNDSHELELALRAPNEQFRASSELSDIAPTVQAPSQREHQLERDPGRSWRTFSQREHQLERDPGRSWRTFSSDCGFCRRVRAIFKPKA